MPPSRSNQSMPVESASLNSPAGRISLPSASTRQPAWTRSLLTCAHPLGRQFERAGVKPRVLGLTEAQLEQLDVSRGFGARIAADDQAQLGGDRQWRGPAGRDDGTVIVELEFTEELVGGKAPVLPRAAQRQAGARPGDDLLELHRSRRARSAAPGFRPGSGPASGPAGARRR